MKRNCTLNTGWQSLRNGAGWLLVAVGVTWLAGCSSKREAAFQKGYMAGQEQARKAQEDKQQPTILFRGPVRQPVVPWEDGVKLSQALDAAGYTGANNPRNLMLIRKGQVFQIAPQKLLSGAVDPVLEPGDVVEVVR